MSRAVTRPSGRAVQLALERASEAPGRIIASDPASPHARCSPVSLPCSCVLTTSPVHGADHRWSLRPQSASTLLTDDQPQGDDGAIGTNIRYLSLAPGTPAQLHFESLMRSPASSDADPIRSDPRVSPPVSPHAVGHRRSLSAPPRIGGASSDKQTEIARNSQE